jgi:hypothetical protein
MAQSKLSRDVPTAPRRKGAARQWVLTGVEPAERVLTRQRIAINRENTCVAGSRFGRSIEKIILLPPGRFFREARNGLADFGRF